MKKLIVILCALLLATPVSGSEPPQGSIYRVPFEWRDETGQPFALATLEGAPVVMTLAYTRCTSACPLTMQRVKKVAEELTATVPTARFIIVSLDPANDTPETLSQFRGRYGLEGAKWKLLTGSDADVRKLSVLLSYSYQRQDGGSEEISHSNKIVALTPEGRIGAEIEGLSSDIAPFVNEVRALATSGKSVR